MSQGFDIQVFNRRENKMNALEALYQQAKQDIQNNHSH